MTWPWNFNLTVHLAMGLLPYCPLANETFPLLSAWPWNFFLIVYLAMELFPYCPLSNGTFPSLSTFQSNFSHIAFSDGSFPWLSFWHQNLSFIPEFTNITLSFIVHSGMELFPHRPFGSGTFSTLSIQQCSLLNNLEKNVPLIPYVAFEIPFTKSHCSSTRQREWTFVVTRLHLDCEREFLLDVWGLSIGLAPRNTRYASRILEYIPNVIYLWRIWRKVEETWHRERTG